MADIFWRAHGKSLTLCLALVCGSAIAGCAAKPPSPTQQAVVIPGKQSHPVTAPICRVEGCCPGRGEKAYLQSDWFVICADGLPSDICDCHYMAGRAEQFEQPTADKPTADKPNTQ